MKTTGRRGNAARVYTRFLALAALLLFASISPAFGQGSEDRNQPDNAEAQARTDDPTDTSSFAGTWLAFANGMRFEMRLKQEGNAVTGAYIPLNGRIQGTVSGATLQFKWTQDGGVSGSGSFSMIKGDQSFRGSLRPSGNPNAAETPWNGVRPPVSFAGVWKVIFDDKVGTLILTQTARQSDDRIEGTLQSVTREGANPLEECTIEGNILRFKLRTNTGRLSGLLAMDKDGKSFKGSIGTAKVTGTFVKPLPN